MLLVVSSTAAAQEWPMFRFDETHQGFVSSNSEFGIFKQQWWNNVSIPATIKGSPVVKDGRVFIGAWDNRIYALDSESGSVLWKNTTTAKITGTPAASESTVYVVTETGTLYAFNARTGALERQVTIGGASFGSPVVHERRVFIGTNAGTVSAYEGDTLSLIWTYKTSDTSGKTTLGNIITEGGQIEGSPVVYNNHVLFGSTNQYFYSVNEQGSGDKKTQLTWIFKAEGAIRSSPAIDKTNGRVIFGAQDGRLYSIALSSTQNATATWTHQQFAAPNLPSQIQSSPAIAYDKTFFGVNNGNVVAVWINNGTVAWVRATSGQVVSSPAVANNYVIIGSGDRNIYLIHQSNGTVAWSRTASSSVEASPAIAGTQAFWGSTDGALYSWGGTKPPRADLTIVSVSGSLVRGESKTISARIQNSGTLPAPGAEVRFFSGNTLIGTDTIGELQPGAGDSVSISYTATGGGTLQIRVVVDPTNVIRETDEGNNEKIQSMRVTEPQTGGTSAAEGEGPGLELIPILIVIAAGAVVLRRRRRE